MCAHLAWPLSSPGLTIRGDLRFVQSDENLTAVTNPKPRISWVDDKAVTITVSDSGYDVTRQLSQIDGIRVLYDFKPQQHRS